MSASRHRKLLLNPDCYETQHQKPHNKLKKAQIQLRENKLSLELKLGGGSTNPTSKGTPPPAATTADCRVHVSPGPCAFRAGRTAGPCAPERYTIAYTIGQLDCS